MRADAGVPRQCMAMSASIGLGIAIGGKATDTSGGNLDIVDPACRASAKRAKRADTRRFPPWPRVRCFPASAATTKAALASQDITGQDADTQATFPSIPRRRGGSVLSSSNETSSRAAVSQQQGAGMLAKKRPGYLHHQDPQQVRAPQDHRRRTDGRGGAAEMKMARWRPRDRAGRQLRHRSSVREQQASRLRG